MTSTMSTDLQVQRIDDVFGDNDVLRLSRENIAARESFAAAAWLSTGAGTKDAHRHASSHVASLVRTKLAGYVFWLLAAHTAWQPDSRMTRYRKLWSSLKARGLRIPLGRDAGEFVLESTEGIRVFGALQVGLDSVDDVVTVLENKPASHLVALRSSDEEIVATLIRSGWALPSTGPSAEILSAVCSANGLVLWPVGHFDDREAGCVAVGRLQVIDELLVSRLDH